MDKREIKKIIGFISGYEYQEQPQSIEEIQGDLQLAGLSTVLNSIISKSSEPNIIDLGCGKGVLIAKLNELSAFQKNPKLNYIGFDKNEYLVDSFKVASNLQLLEKIKLLALHDNWDEHVNKKSIIVIRNVLHELVVSDAAKLVYKICHKLPKKSCFILQDMSTLPVAEKGKAGWLGVHLENIFNNAGFDTALTGDKSKNGVDIFLIEGVKSRNCTLDFRKIYNLLLAARKDQLELLHYKYKKLEENKNNKLPILRITHDIAAISYQIGEESKNVKDIENTVSSLFQLAFYNISGSDFDLLISSFKFPEISWFQNRLKPLQSIDDFILSSKTFLLIRGGPFIGKKTLVFHAFCVKKYERLPIYINLNQGVDLVTLLETIAVQLNVVRQLDAEILSKLSSLPNEKLRQEMLSILTRFVSKSVLILDGYENIVNPKGITDNEDVTWLINVWSSTQHSKLIILSRVKVLLPENTFEIVFLNKFYSHEKGRFGEHQNTVRMLQSLIPLDYRLPEKTDFGGFPQELINLLDNHPHFIYLAATIVRNNPDSLCLSDNLFVENIKNELFDNLINTFKLTTEEKELLKALSMLRNPFPLKLISMASSNSNLAQSFLEKGLILEHYPGTFRPIEFVKSITIDDLLIIEDREEEKKVFKDKWNIKFYEAYKLLYKETSNPIFLRESYYHSTMARTAKFSVNNYFLPELSTCANKWFEEGRYHDSCWAYQEINKMRVLYQKERMRFASCLVRTDGFEDGSKIYNHLFAEFPDWIGTKFSYVDSLIYTKNYPEVALDFLNNEFPYEQKKAYWCHRAAKCYRQLSMRTEAYEHFERAISIEPAKEKISIILLEFANYAREVGDTEKETYLIETIAWHQLKLRTYNVKVSLGSLYERIDRLPEAEELLKDSYQINPSNAYCLLPLIKTLCRNNDIDTAKYYLDQPFNYRPKYLYYYAKVFYFKTIEKFVEAEQLLTEIINQYTLSVHQCGQWADLFLTWALSTYGDEQNELVERGLKYAEESLQFNNVPCLLAHLELAKLIGDADIRHRIQEKLSRIRKN